MSETSVMRAQIENPRPRFRLLASAALVSCLLTAAGCSPNASSPPSSTPAASSAPASASGAQATASAIAAAPGGSPPATAQPVPVSAKAQPLPPIPPTIFSHGPRTRRQVALTFDLCEAADPDHAGFDKKLADELIHANVPATLFVGGKWAMNHQDDARWLGEQPLFEIGQHSWDHPHMTKLSAAQAKQEVVRAQDEVARLTGHTPRYFRYPYGEADRPTLAMLGKLGLTAIQWEVESGDPDPHETKNVMMADIKRWLRPGSIIIMHMNGRGVHSAETLPTLIAYLRAHGYEMVWVSDLLKGAKMDKHPVMSYTTAGLPKPSNL